jgi:hypothetical protein
MSVGLSIEAWLAEARGRGTTLPEALATFDQLPSVSCDEMIGHWRGGGLPTGHPMDGMLEAYDWHGKSFLDVETVHPLVFRSAHGHRIAIDPRRVPLVLAPYRAVWAHPVSRALFRVGIPLLRTATPRARLRAVACRGVVTATMLYDHLPIADSFRRVNADTVLGLMDQRGAAPFFFVLEREA